MNQYRQGDVLLIRAEGVDLTRGVRVKPEAGRNILARGEATGHHHSVDVAASQLFSIDGKMVLVVDEPATLDHQEHGAIEIDLGVWWVVRQQEYSRGEVRRVIQD